SIDRSSPMFSLMQGRGRLPLNALALALGAWVFSGSSAAADGDGLAGVGHGPSSYGTLGYGPPGLYPRFPGVGLGYHPGCCYGGAALGPGADGGYPFYGGPGYPHPWPCLRRFKKITPFPYYGGPGGPTPDHPNSFGGVGPLVAGRPVITIGIDGSDLYPAGGY